jgi:hypothetical protein
MTGIPDRACENGPARLLSLLLYAETAGIEVPGAVLAALGERALDHVR